MSKWPIISLVEVAAPKRGSVNPFNFPKEIFDLYSIPAYDCGMPEIVTGDHIGSSKQIVAPGDVLLSRIVPHIRRVWVAGENMGRRMIASGEWIVFNNPQISPRFLHYFLLGDPFHNQFMQTVSGVGGSLLRAKASETFKIRIPLPPLPEQERIVKLLDEADALRKLRNKSDKRSMELIPALFNEMFGDSKTNPFGWKESKLSDSCIKIADGTHFSPPPVNCGVPYITAKHLRPYGLDFDRDPTYVSKERHDEIYKRCDPRNGDVLYIKDGATTGIAAINHYDFEFSMLSSLALLRCEPTKCCSEYLCEWLNNKDVKSTMLDQMSGSAIKRLTLVKIKKSKILLPPLPLQKEFASRVSEIRAMESEQSSSRQSLDALFQSMLHRAFQGEL
jgi:type I restriction enzyme S subunit